MTSTERIASLFEGKDPNKPLSMHISFSGRSASIIPGREAYVGGGNFASNQGPMYSPRVINDLMREG